MAAWQLAIIYPARRTTPEGQDRDEKRLLTNIVMTMPGGALCRDHQKQDRQTGSHGQADHIGYSRGREATPQRVRRPRARDRLLRSVLPTGLPSAPASNASSPITSAARCAGTPRDAEPHAAVGDACLPNHLGCSGDRDSDRHRAPALDPACTPEQLDSPGAVENVYWQRLPSTMLAIERAGVPCCSAPTSADPGRAVTSSTSMPR